MEHLSASNYDPVVWEDVKEVTDELEKRIEELETKLEEMEIKFEQLLNSKGEKG